MIERNLLLLLLSTIAFVGFLRFSRRFKDGVCVFRCGCWILRIGSGCAGVKTEHIGGASRGCGT